jgi:peptidoglycan-associated lipoprotein
MNLRSLATLGGSMLLAAVLSACGSNVKLDETPPVESRTATPVGSGGQSQSQVSSVTAPSGSTSQLDAASQLARVVYFDFDSYVLKDEFRPTVAAYARLLTADAQRRLMIEGHTDERGGSEYNLALGQKRAEAVRRALELLGVRENQIEAVSYGKERPAVAGSNEEAWAKNRRAELILR